MKTFPRTASHMHLEKSLLQRVAIAIVVLAQLLAAAPLAAQSDTSAPLAQRATPQMGSVHEQFHKMLQRPSVNLIPAVESPQSTVVIHGRFHSEAREEVPFLIWKPPAAKGPLPAVILLHGTGGSKEVWYDIGTRLATRGLLAIAIDGRYHGERAHGDRKAYNDAIVRAWREKDPTRQEHPLYYDTVYDVWRTIDYLQTRDDVDPNRIGLAGISKGGIEAWMAAATDERIRVVVPDIAVQSFAWSFSQDRWQGRVRTVGDAARAVATDMGKASVDAESAKALFSKLLPGIFDKFDCPQMLPAIAPRPMLILSGDKDPNNPIEGAELAFAAARAAYRQQNATDRLRIKVGKGLGHDTPEEHIQMMVDWLVTWLNRGASDSEAVRKHAENDCQRCPCRTSSETESTVNPGAGLREWKSVSAARLAGAGKETR